jgi:serine/threonine protein kinase
MAQTAHSGLMMLDPRESQFWQTAVKSGLITAAKLEECWRAIPVEKRTADAIDRRLARQCVNSGLITIWQAQQILTGRPHGLRIDRYILQDLIGQGGMGRVFLAKDTRLSRLVALKILSKERMANERAVRRFRREGKVGAQLQHENLVRVYDEGEVGGMPYLVLEYISGRTVLQMINEQGRLPWSMAAELARQVALGLEHLHQKGLLHRDVNPANIMVDRDGTAKLTDLGLAIDLGDEDEDRVTRDGATVGTFDYISPEQARNPREIDVRSDIYSLGCSLYHMIAGRVPFPAPSLPEKLLAHQTHPPDPLPSLVPGVPEELDAVVRKMMSKSPGDRYPRPGAVVRALAPYSTRSRPFEDAQTPAAGSLRWNDSAPAPKVAVAAPPGSDAELPAVRASQPQAPALPSPSGSLDFQLDYGPQPSISESLSNARSRSSEHFFSRHGPWTWIGLAMLVGLLLFSFRPRDRSDASRATLPTAPADADSSESKKPAPDLVPRKPGLSVVYDGGNQVDVDSFRDAVSRAQGKKGAEIVVAGTVNLNLKDSRTPASENLVIRGEPGTHPILRLTRDELPTSFLQMSEGKLLISGLSIEIAAPPGVVPPPGTLFFTLGSIEVEDCSFTAGPGAQNVVPIVFEGGRARIQKSWFGGFQTSLSLNLYPDSQVEIVHSMFTPFDPARAPTPQWPLTVKAMPSRDKNARRISIDHCTICGPGLVRLTGVGAQTPVDLRIDATVADVEALVLWDNPAEPFPAGLHWAGQGNLYDVGAAWVLGPPDGKAPVANAPVDLASWCRATVSEAGTRAVDVRFVRDPPGIGRTPDHYALIGVMQPKPGADPGQVAVPGGGP